MFLRFLIIIMTIIIMISVAFGDDDEKVSSGHDDHAVS